MENDQNPVSDELPKDPCPERDSFGYCQCKRQNHERTAPRFQ